MAEKGDVSVRYWRRIETGRENLTLSALVWLANLLGVKTVDLMECPADLLGCPLVFGPLIHGV